MPDNYNGNYVRWSGTTSSSTTYTWGYDTPSSARITKPSPPKDEEWKYGGRLNMFSWLVSVGHRFEPSRSGNAWADALYAKIIDNLRPTHSGDEFRVEYRSSSGWTLEFGVQKDIASATGVVTRRYMWRALPPPASDGEAKEEASP